MKELIIKVLMVEPLNHPKEIYIINNQDVFSILVSMDNYYISDAKLTYLDENVAIIHNEEAELLNLKGNRRIDDKIIAGTFLVVGINDTGIITSLTDEILEKYKKIFWNIEVYSDKEVSKSYWNSIERLINSFE